MYKRQADDNIAIGAYTALQAANMDIPIIACAFIGNVENKWYEADTVQDSGFFTDLQSRSREKIVWFPKIYYQMEKGLLHIRCEITLGKYQDQLLRLEDKLESGLYCELTDKTLHAIFRNCFARSYAASLYSWK